jgi:pimeloyl-ACP methyl ester carboxylesterase
MNTLSSLTYAMDLSTKKVLWILLLPCAVALTLGCSKQALFINAVDNVPIAYETHGFGSPALIFVHGWSCDRTYWKNQVKTFSQKYEVITLDLAGHGDSGIERDDWTIESFGSDVSNVVKKLGLNEVILIGHSMGGDVIVAAAQSLTDRVKGLIWIDVYKKLGDYRTTEQSEAFIAPFRNSFKEKTSSFVKNMFPPGSDPSLVARVANDMSSAPPHIAIDALKSAITYDRKVTAALDDLKLPAIAINPDRPGTDTLSLKKYGVKTVVMAGVGHFPMLEKPDQFNQILFNAVEELARKSQ